MCEVRQLLSWHLKLSVYFVVPQLFFLCVFCFKVDIFVMGAQRDIRGVLPSGCVESNM